MARLPVDDPDDPRIAEFVGLRERALRQGRRPADPRYPLPDPHGATGGTGGPAAGVFVAEGDIVVERALQAGYRLRCLLVDATRRDPLPRAVEAAATRAPAVPVYAASPAVLRRITGLGVHRGILGSFDRRPPRPAGELLADPAVRRIVVLERVSNPTNLGVVLRSARGLGIDAALLDPTCTDPLYRRVSRVAMGEGYAFPWAVLPRLPGGLDPVREAGFRLVALTPDPAATPVDALAPGPEDRVALLLGAEGSGLSPDTMAAVDVRAGIPMRAGVDSLNVGVAAGIAFWVLGRDRSARI